MNGREWRAKDGGRGKFTKHDEHNRVSMSEVVFHFTCCGKKTSVFFVSILFVFTPWVIKTKLNVFLDRSSLSDAVKFNIHDFVHKHWRWIKKISIWLEKKIDPIVAFVDFTSSRKSKLWRCGEKEIRTKAIISSETVSGSSRVIGGRRENLDSVFGDCSINEDASILWNVIDGKF